MIIYMNIHSYVYLCIGIYLDGYVYSYKYTYVYSYVCSHMYIYIGIYIYIKIDTVPFCIIFLEAHLCQGQASPSRTQCSTGDPYPGRCSDGEGDREENPRFSHFLAFVPQGFCRLSLQQFLGHSLMR